MQEEISILLSANEKYSRQCAVTILSILGNTSLPQKINFYVLTPDISIDNREKIKKLCHYFDSKVIFVDIDITLFDAFPIPALHSPTSKFKKSKDVYSRLLGPDLLKQCNRLLYLDCDLVVLGDVIDLFYSSLNGMPIGAVPHVQFPYQEVFVKTFEMQEVDIYFNSGVILIDAEMWRNKVYSNNVVDLLEKYGDKISFADQDILNILFWKNYFHLPGIWNVESRLYKAKLLGLPQTEETTERMRSPQIIHYTGPEKPWLSRQYVPKREIYLEYSDRLSSLLNWLPNSDIRGCHPLKFSSFVWSCLYFRGASLKKRFLFY